MKKANILIILLLLTSFSMLYADYYIKNNKVIYNSPTYEELKFPVIRESTDLLITDNITVVEIKEKVVNTTNLVKHKFNKHVSPEKQYKNEKDVYIEELMNLYNVDKEGANILFERQSIIR